MPPVQAVTKRAASRLIYSGDAHKRCAIADLYAAQYSISRDIFELLDAEHTQYVHQSTIMLIHQSVTLPLQAERREAAA